MCCLRISQKELGFRKIAIPKLALRRCVKPLVEIRQTNLKLFIQSNQAKESVVYVCVEN